MLRIVHSSVLRRSHLKSSIFCKVPHHRRTILITPNSTIFSGIQPTGVPHLGNYLGALHQWRELQDQSHPSVKLLFSIVDLHSLTVPQNRERLRRWKKEALVTLLAIGLKPERCIIFYQSEIPAHSQLMWILSCTSSVGYLSRMTQWKSKLKMSENSTVTDAHAKANLKLGLFSYPVLQAADILVHGTTHVPVGEDQSQHLEFARECAQNFNSLHGTILRKPETLLGTGRRIMSLRDPQSKMSKSHLDPRSRIILTDKPEDIRAKVRAAVTDSGQNITYDLQMRPGIANLLNILSYFDSQGRSPEKLAEEYQQSNIQALKDAVSDSLVNVLAPVRDKYETLMQQNAEYQLKEIMYNGRKRAIVNSRNIMEKINQALGI